MIRPVAHNWAFAPRFGRRAFGWRSQPAVQRVREAVAEIRKVAKKDPALAAAGAVLFIEKVSPALEEVDGSSGAIGTAVNHAIEACATIIAAAAADDRTRDRWLERLREAHQNDEIPYIERLADHWGELCASRERASAWADRLIGTVEAVWSPDRKPGDYFHGRKAEAIRYAEASRGEGRRALERGDCPRAANALRPAHADPGRSRLRRHESTVRRRSGPGRPALDRRRLRLRDHGCRRAHRMLEHPGCREERRMHRRDRGTNPCTDCRSAIDSQGAHCHVAWDTSDLLTFKPVLCRPLR